MCIFFGQFFIILLFITDVIFYFLLNEPFKNMINKNILSISHNNNPIFLHRTLHKLEKIHDHFNYLEIICYH